MFTEIKTKSGEKISLVTQQYASGTYCIVNADPSQQFGVTTKEDKFHIAIRRKALKTGDSIINGSIIPNGKASKINLNPFI